MTMMLMLMVTGNVNVEEKEEEDDDDDKHGGVVVFLMLKGAMFTTMTVMTIVRVNLMTLVTGWDGDVDDDETCVGLICRQPV